jgi:hypothetical protein
MQAEDRASPAPAAIPAGRRTTVINIHGRDPAALRADPRFVYVGWVVRTHGWPGSFWGVGMTAPTPAGRAAAAGRLGREIAGDSERARFLRSRLGELRGKVLGCWCCDWDGHGEPAVPCHAVVLARLADAPPERDAPRRR